MLWNLLDERRSGSSFAAESAKNGAFYFGRHGIENETLIHDGDPVKLTLY